MYIFLQIEAMKRGFYFISFMIVLILVNRFVCKLNDFVYLFGVKPMNFGVSIEPCELAFCVVSAVLLDHLDGIFKSPFSIEIFE